MCTVVFCLFCSEVKVCKIKKIQFYTVLLSLVKWIWCLLSLLCFPIPSCTFILVIGYSGTLKAKVTCNHLAVLKSPNIDSKGWPQTSM